MRGVDIKPSDAELEERLARLEPPAPAPELLDRLLAVPDTVPAAPANTRGLRWRPFALASGLAAGLAGILLFLAARTTPAFAQVEQALQKVRYASWTETGTWYQPSGTAPPPAVTEVWGRSEPPALDRRQRNGFRTLWTGSAQYTYDPFLREYSVTHPRMGPRAFMARIILYQIVAPEESNPRSKWTSQRETLEGRPVIRFQREYTFRLRPGLPAGVTPSRSEETVWVDEESYRVLRRERRQYSGRENRLEYLDLASDFRYDQPPPPGTFEWEPPAGALQVDRTTTPVWDRLSSSEQDAIRTLIGRCTVGWVAGDFKTFASAWDFDYLDHFANARRVGAAEPTGADRRRAWKIRLENVHRYQKVHWSSWHSRVLSANAQRFVERYGGLPEHLPPVLQVEADGELTREDGSHATVRSTYYLGKTPAGYRIIFWRHGLSRQQLVGS